MSDNTLTIEVDLPTDGTIDGTEKKPLRFKPLSVVPIGILRRTRHDQQEQMWAVFEWALSADDLAVLDVLPASQLRDILAAMQAKSDIDLGE